MPHALRAPVTKGLSELADEFRQLDRQRRERGLTLGESARYRSLFERLSESLASGERHRTVDTRQFLRVPFVVGLTLMRSRGPVMARCRDFGGGGCSIETDELLAVGDDVWLAGACVAEEVEPQPLRGRAVVVWADPATATYGLRFCLDVADERDQIDRLFYRLLDRFLRT
jgi:PilZ domain